MTYKYFLGLGSNIEPRVNYLQKACDHLSQLGKISKKSSLYQTQAWGNRRQADFYNAIIVLESHLSPQKLLKEIKNIEIFIGRERRRRWEPREIDIDIIFCPDFNVNEPDLKIPHPLLSQRQFVLVPLAEIDKSMCITALNQSISELLDSCTDQSYIQKLDLLW